MKDKDFYYVIVFLKMIFYFSTIDPEKIEVVNENEIPLTIFGKLLPKMSETDFRLPWLTTKEELNKERNSIPKRNASKRRKT